MLQKVVLSSPLLLLVFFSTSHASICDAKKNPDLSLSLTIDVSGSTSVTELKAQMEGYKAAFSSEEIQKNLLTCQCSEVSIVLWGDHTETVFDPRKIRSMSEINQMIDLFTSLSETQWELWGVYEIGANTNVANALRESANILKERKANRLVIDISGDGKHDVRNSSLAELAAVKEDLNYYGIRVNGIPIVSPESANFIKTNPNSAAIDLISPVQVPLQVQQDLELVKFYKNNVISSPYGRLTPADDYTDFPRAVYENIKYETCNPLM